ncbi:MAG: flavin reductase family protein [Candidatus Limnocylindrales bacterium]
MTAARDPRPVVPVDAVSPERFRQGFRRLAATVGVVVYRDLEGIVRGMTATSLCALSATPPSLLVCVERSTRTHAELEHLEIFALELLAADQREIARFCARPGADKILPVEWLVPVASDAAPRLAGTIAHFGCRIERVEPAFSHSIVIARIQALGLGPDDAEPLLYRDGRFRSLAPQD